MTDTEMINKHAEENIKTQSWRAQLIHHPADLCDKAKRIHWLIGRLSAKCLLLDLILTFPEGEAPEILDSAINHLNSKIKDYK